MMGRKPKRNESVTEAMEAIEAHRARHFDAVLATLAEAASLTDPGHVAKVRITKNVGLDPTPWCSLNPDTEGEWPRGGFKAIALGPRFGEPLDLTGRPWADVVPAEPEPRRRWRILP